MYATKSTTIYDNKCNERSYKMGRNETPMVTSKIKIDIESRFSNNNYCNVIMKESKWK